MPKNTYPYFDKNSSSVDLYDLYINSINPKTKMTYLSSVDLYDIYINLYINSINPKTKMTSLCQAAVWGHFHAVMKLLSLTTLVPNTENIKAYRYAKINGHHGIATMLALFGFFTDQEWGECEISEEDCFTVIHNAIMHNRLFLLNRLHARMCQPSTKIGVQRSCYRALLRFSHDEHFQQLSNLKSTLGGILLSVGDQLPKSNVRVEFPEDAPITDPLFLIELIDLFKQKALNLHSLHQKLGKARDIDRITLLQNLLQEDQVPVTLARIVYDSVDNQIDLLDSLLRNTKIPMAAINSVLPFNVRTVAQRAFIDPEKLGLLNYMGINLVSPYKEKRFFAALGSKKQPILTGDAIRVFMQFLQGDDLRHAAMVSREFFRPVVDNNFSREDPFVSRRALASLLDPMFKERNDKEMAEINRLMRIAEKENDKSMAEINRLMRIAEKWVESYIRESHFCYSTRDNCCKPVAHFFFIGSLVMFLCGFLLNDKEQEVISAALKIFGSISTALFGFTLESLYLYYHFTTRTDGYFNAELIHNGHYKTAIGIAKQCGLIENDADPTPSEFKLLLETYGQATTQEGAGVLRLEDRGRNTIFAAATAQTPLLLKNGAAGAGAGADLEQGYGAANEGNGYGESKG